VKVDERSIGMTTAPRRRPTLHHAVRSLREAGFHERLHLFCEPGSPRSPVDGRLTRHANRCRLGCFGNWDRALGHLLRHESAGWLMIVQDDAIWSPGAASILRAEIAGRQAQRIGFLSPYVTGKDVSDGFVEGWNLYEGGWNLWGALALCMPRDAALDLVRHGRYASHPGPNAIDAVVAASMLDLGRPSLVRVPSLVDHVGETSTIGHDDVAGGLRGHRFGQGA